MVYVEKHSRKQLDETERPGRLVLIRQLPRRLQLDITWQ